MSKGMKVVNKLDFQEIEWWDPMENQRIIKNNFDI